MDAMGFHFLTFVTLAIQQGGSLFRLLLWSGANKSDIANRLLLSAFHWR